MSVAADVHVASVRLDLRNWHGHPEMAAIGEAYHQRNRADGRAWESGLRCWNLIDDDGLKVGRVYEPTATTPRWVWTDTYGGREAAPMLSMDKLRVLMVEYRLRGGFDR